LRLYSRGLLMSCASERDLSAVATSRGGWLRLWVVSVLLTLVWCGVLPALGRRPGVRERIEFLEGRGINPSAKFFTEQEAGWRNAAEVERRVRANPEAFWGLPWSGLGVEGRGD
jgi:hypothetical protein